MQEWLLKCSSVFQGTACSMRQQDFGLNSQASDTESLKLCKLDVLYHGAVGLTNPPSCRLGSQLMQTLHSCRERPLSQQAP